jgi:type IV secretory pathway component VirB8
MRKRWMWGGLLSDLSTYRVYQSFEKEYPIIEAELKGLGASRSVEILSIERIGGEKSMAWKIEFKTYDYIQRGEMQINDEFIEPEVIERYWTANIQRMSSVNRRVAYRRLLNPLGFIVVSYYQSEIEI